MPTDEGILTLDNDNIPAHDLLGALETAFVPLERYGFKRDGDEILLLHLTNFHEEYTPQQLRSYIVVNSNRDDFPLLPIIRYCDDIPPLFPQGDSIQDCLLSMAKNQFHFQGVRELEKKRERREEHIRRTYSAAEEIMEKQRKSKEEGERKRREKRRGAESQKIKRVKEEKNRLRLELMEMGEKVGELGDEDLEVDREGVAIHSLDHVDFDEKRKNVMVKKRKKKRKMYVGRKKRREKKITIQHQKDMNEEGNDSYGDIVSSIPPLPLSKIDKT